MVENCLTCFYFSGLAGRTLQLGIDSHHPDFRCEDEKCSPYSPGPVEDVEDVAFLIINPTHIDEVTGILTPDAFGELTRRDLSVLRSAKTRKAEARWTHDILVERGLKKMPAEMRRIDEVLIAKVLEIRAYEDPAGRILAVYDTAIESNSGHASIFTNGRSLNGGRLSRKRLRAACHELFHVRQAYSDFENALPN